jgi:transcriptional regulator with XRE-family HTH domain
MLVMKINLVDRCPEEVTAIAQRLGERIRIARVRRRLRQGDMAARTGLSRSTIQAIERGNITCSFGAVLHVLWNLGLSTEIEIIADPGLDDRGLALSLTSEGKRVRVPTKIDNDF